MAKVISFLNFKGGVGKSTSTVNTAKALHDMGYKILVIDADAQGNSSKMMGKKLSEGNDETLYEAMTKGMDIRECICMDQDKEESFDYVGSNQKLGYAEMDIYDLVILDVMMPKMNGYQVAQQLRAKHITVPVLMLTAKSELMDRIEGLNAGADYYLTKPFDTRELMACINALLRRQGSQINVLTFGNTTLDLTACMLSCGENEIRLSAREFDVMRLLMQSGAANISKESLLVRVWGYDSNAVENHVEVYVGFLRKKLASIGSNIRIEAIRRLGYHLEVDDI